MTTYKGIVLAGGSGTRLYPLTLSMSKQLLPIYDKPMIFYPISVLMLAGIREILIVTTAESLSDFKNLLGTGEDFGVEFTYVIQQKPEGIAQALILAEPFLAGSPCCLVLGDNIFYGQHFVELLNQATRVEQGCTVFAYHVTNPQRFGVVELDAEMKVLSIEEKPKQPKSNYVVTGLYFFDSTAVAVAKTLSRSNRGEFEITDVIRSYISNNKLNVSLLGRGFAWLDTGTYDSLLDAGHFVETIEKRQGLKIACLEEIAYRKGWLSKEQVIARAQLFQQNAYGKYLLDTAT
ncbi:glucose-1-phosphate thymidylyltransferase RfbA [Rheinheimera tangshanensis]|uniref:Glucose-1-phosphate thymidylyltransferase n=1 Tax=Rheinheimera tangshanensis TaxID=400153 RepID=A0A5C8LYP9_9GAMM|nr:glucose-1-phosphate thymidylyltransferase RfbA [Rheinheimera tangshanensis]TXK80592.1 glucose-1-phosphate thymidylyltransferase RfbA [Rheinheimera tangshanensis]